MTFQPVINEKSRKMEYPSPLQRPRGKGKFSKVQEIEEFQKVAESLAQIFKESRGLKK